jgi:hypothetical protein
MANHTVELAAIFETQSDTTGHVSRNITMSFIWIAKRLCRRIAESDKRSIRKQVSLKPELLAI